MTAVELAPSSALGGQAPPRLRVRGLEQHVDGRRVLQEMDMDVAAGEVVAIIGGSGAGKTTLLETMLGIRPPTGGVVEVDGIDRTGAGPLAMGVGYVPQDDIVHHDLPLRRTIRHAAALRLPATASRGDAEAVVDDVLDRLGLTHRSHVDVGALSGGERKRASVAVELLNRPPILFLDEPTSGLDPASAADLLDHLHHLGGGGAAVVLTTHAPADVDRCDRVVFLAGDGHVVFVGTPAELRRHFQVDDLVDAYTEVSGEGSAKRWSERFQVSRTDAAPTSSAVGTSGDAQVRSVPGRIRQWWALSRRSGDLLLRNRLTLAVLLGSPTAVTVMMAVMFQPGVLDTGAVGVQSVVQTVYWLAFAGFFFGLTYGLLQIVVELPIVRRDRLAGMHVGAYVLAKVTVLAPVLAIVSAGMLAVLRALDRLPEAPWQTWAQLELTLVLTSLAALTTGLLASAAVADATQATLALPMICFPQVLFAGALVPASAMASVGRWAGVGLVDRWSFEALGRVLDVDALVGDELAEAGYGGALAGSPVGGWISLGLLAVAGFVASVLALAGRTAVGRS